MKTPHLETPWGPSHHVRVIAPGITSVSTASHGGILLSPERLASMPPALRAIKPWAGEGSYEEDCDWAIVVAAFWQYFDETDAYFACCTMRHHSNNAAFFAYCATPEGKSFVSRADDFYERNKTKFSRGGCSTSGGDWLVFASNLMRTLRATWTQPDYPSEALFDIEAVKAAGYAVKLEAY